MTAIDKLKDQEKSTILAFASSDRYEPYAICKSKEQEM
jgi:hypothetical protein